MTNITVAEQKLQDYFDKLLLLVEKTSKTEEDSVLLAGAMMSVARILYFDNLSKEEAKSVMEHNTIDFIELMKPTIH
jgi:hypothetical protein|tara:strand:- start:165 stop:395 length:231 start_codon:yes stop_codon:yes gene_type:complete